MKCCDNLSLTVFVIRAAYRNAFEMRAAYNNEIISVYIIKHCVTVI